MTLLALSAIDYDPDGSGLVRVTAGSALQVFGGTRRQTKTATLDGGVSLYDTGFTRTDDKWDLRGPANPGAVALIEHLARNYPRIRVSTFAGVFGASISSFRLDGADVLFQLSILQDMMIEPAPLKYSASCGNQVCINVTIEPQGAIDAGAKWYLLYPPDYAEVDATEHESGEVVPYLPEGTYKIAHKVISGWNGPDIKTYVFQLPAGYASYSWSITDVPYTPI